MAKKKINRFFKGDRGGNFIIFEESLGKEMYESIERWWELNGNPHYLVAQLKVIMKYIWFRLADQDYDKYTEIALAWFKKLGREADDILIRDHNPFWNPDPRWKYKEMLSPYGYWDKGYWVETSAVKTKYVVKYLWGQIKDHKIELYGDSKADLTDKEIEVIKSANIGYKEKRLLIAGLIWSKLNKKRNLDYDLKDKHLFDIAKVKENDYFKWTDCEEGESGYNLVERSKDTLLHKYLIDTVVINQKEIDSNTDRNTYISPVKRDIYKPHIQEVVDKLKEAFGTGEIILTIKAEQLDHVREQTEILLGKDNYKVCKDCGLLFIPTGNRQIRCLDCKREVERLKKQRQRARKKEEELKRVG